MSRETERGRTRHEQAHTHTHKQHTHNTHTLPQQILPPSLYVLLRAWYGGGPLIERTVAKIDNGSLDLELYPLLLRVAVAGPDGRPGSSSGGGGRGQQQQQQQSGAGGEREVLFR